MVDWHIEESLNLVGMQIHRYHSVDTSNTQQVSHQLGANADTWFVLAVLTSPSEIGYHGDDVTG